MVKRLAKLALANQILVFYIGVEGPACTLHATMKGRVSFTDEDGDRGEGEDNTRTSKLPKMTSTTVATGGQPTSKFMSKGVARRTRGLATESSTSTKHGSVSLLEQVRDRVILPMTTVAAEAGGFLPSDAYDDVQEDTMSREQAQMVQEARRRRMEARNEETILDGYISLEKVTQSYLDPYDIHTMISNDGSRRRRRPKNTWEDPDDIDESTVKPTRMDSESDLEADMGKAPNEEEEDYSIDRTDGRLPMKVTDIDDRFEQTSLQEPEDEETRKWELQQLRKGMASSGTAAPRAARKATNLLAMAAVREQAGAQRELIPSMTVATIREELSSEEQGTQTSLKSLHNDLDQIRAHQAECQRRADELESSMAPVKERVIFFRELEELLRDHAESTGQILSLVAELERAQLASRHDADANCMERAKCQSLREKLVDPAKLESKLLEWRDKYPQSFTDSYVDLCVAQLWEPYVRLEFIYFDLFLLKEEEDGESVEERLQRSLDQCLPTSLASPESQSQVLASLILPHLGRLIKSTFDVSEPAHYKVLNRLLVYSKSLGLPSIARPPDTFLIDTIIEVLLAAPADKHDVIRHNIRLIEVIAGDPLGRERLSLIMQETT